MAKTKSVIRSSVALLVVFSFTLSLLPDSLLDFFHQHEHTHCTSHFSGELSIEAAHFDCEFPDLYLDFYQHSRPVFAHYPFIFGFLFPNQSSNHSIQPAWHTCGRAPPGLG